MNNETSELEPVDVEGLFTEFSDCSLAELMVTIKDLRKDLEHEKKAHSYDERLLRKAEETIVKLTARINTASAALIDEPTQEE